MALARRKPADDVTEVLYSVELDGVRYTCSLEMVFSWLILGSITSTPIPLVVITYNRSKYLITPKG